MIMSKGVEAFIAWSIAVAINSEMVFTCSLVGLAASRWRDGGRIELSVDWYLSQSVLLQFGWVRGFMWRRGFSKRSSSVMKTM